MRTWLRARRRETTVLWHRLQPGPHALVLAYHRVIDLPSDPYDLCTKPELFHEHLKLLENRVVPLLEIAAGAPGIALTFDDGYADNLETVAPVLKKHRMPATFFVTAHPCDREFWWNELEQRCLRTPTRWKLFTEPPRTQDERELKRRYLAGERGDPQPVRPTHRLLSPDELRLLAQDYEIGAHTLSHPHLSRLDVTAQGREIEGSRRHLQEVLQRPVTSFAYPYGEYDQTAVSLAKESFTSACTIAPGRVTPSTDRFLLPRVHADGMPLEVLDRLLRLGNLR